MMPMSSSSSSINSLNSSSSINSMNSSSGNLGPKRTTNEDNLNFPGQWRFSQCFGDKTETLEVAEGDIISALSFNRNGNFMASGDRAGRVVLFERPANTNEYRFYTEFQSHESEFDYLKSLEINERINKIEWWDMQPVNDALFLLSTNDKTIKLWKIRERQVQLVLENNSQPAAKLILPRTSPKESIIAATPRRVYSNAHAYHIHSISANSDGETFLSSDDLRINLWHMEHPNESYCVVDIKPATIEELTEVITCAKFHPAHCNLLAFSTSKGAVRLADMRDSAIIDGKASRSLGPGAASDTPSFFSEIVSSISDVAFCRGDANLLAARDYMSVKVWDVRSDARPLYTLPVHEYIKPKLCDLYENDSIFDKFNLAFSSDGRYIATGSYGNRVRILPVMNTDTTYLETITADKSILAARGNTSKQQAMGKKSGMSGAMQLKELDADSVDYEKKITHLAMHPEGNCLALAASTNLFMFTSTTNSSSSVKNQF